MVTIILVLDLNTGRSLKVNRLENNKIQLLRYCIAQPEDHVLEAFHTNNKVDQYSSA